MPRMNERAAEGLDPARAGELVRVLDLQARWENMRVGNQITTGQLRELQRAFEAYQASLTAFTARRRGDRVPELTPAGPDRLGRWCRTVWAVCRSAGEGGYPAHVMAKAYDLADRIARRTKADPPVRGKPPTDLAGAVRQLGEVAAWCDWLGGALPPDGGRCHEVGG